MFENTAFDTINYINVLKNYYIGALGNVNI